MLKGNPQLWHLITIFLAVLVSLTAQIASSKESIVKDNLSNVQITRNITSMPLAFTANQGQWDDQVLFRANANGATMWFASDGAYYQFTRTIESEDNKPISIVDKRYGMPVDDIFDREPKSVETMMIKATFVGANPNPRMIGVDMMDYKCNYFIGNDPNEWHTDVPNFSAVLYEEIYDGINLKYYGNGRQMEYDFIVSPGADYSQIRIHYEGAESISINGSGELIVTTKWGEVIEQRPVIYQIENNSRIVVEGEYKMMGDNSFGFELSSYNPALPLVIDPLLSYSTYLGGSGDETNTRIATDDSGNAYITGKTVSTDFPTEGEYQTDQGGRDVFVTKLNSSGNALVYSTYLGGNGYDAGNGIAVDGSGNAYITGNTNSTNFPTEGAYQTFQGVWDVFVTKLNSSGNALVYSTYLGGDGSDVGWGIVVDISGNTFVTGYTQSTNFPTEGAYQATHQGNFDVFVTKLNFSGNALVYSTYVGGSDLDISFGIAVDGSGNAYITGYTFSTDFPTVGAYQASYQGEGDVFVTKLNSSGNALVYNTYLGGDSSDIGWGIAVDDYGNAYIAGFTFSTDFPTEGEYQTDQSGTDAFVTKLNSSGNALVYSTYLGGSSNDEALGIALDASDNAYVTGWTLSTDFPTEGEFQTDQDGRDAFVTKLNSSGNALVYSTYLGGSGDDIGRSISVGNFGNIYINGYTTSIDFPTEGEYQTDQVGWDAFVTKFTPPCCDGNRGDLNGDGDDASILDLTFMVDFIFRGSGDPGACPEESDVNGDGDSANILDLTYLVDFIFRGGDPPGPC